MSFIQSVNDQLLSTLQDFLSGITNLSFAICDSYGGVLIGPKSDDRAASHFTTCASDRKGYEGFVRIGIGKAVMRKDPSLFKGPTGEYHLFIPARINSCKLVFVSSPFHAEKAKFEAMAAHIKCLIEMFSKISYKSSLLNKSFKRTKTLTDILLGIQLPASTVRVYTSVLDAILLLFDVDTASVMVQEKDVFKTIIASGRLRAALKSLCLETNNPLISQSFHNLTPVFSDDIENICKLGFPINIKSIYVFPFSNRNNSYGLLLLYNAFLSDEESQQILDFCKIIAIVHGNLNLQSAYHQGIADTEVLDIAVAQLTPHFHNTEALCKIMLNKAMEIVEAEKGSLMLPKDANLLVKASEGVNRWLLQDVKIKKGEGIAGKVFRDKKPFFVKNLDEVTVPDFKPKSRYKTDSFISLPLVFGSETIGVLNIADKRTGEKFSERDFHLLNHFSSYSSCALRIATDYAVAERMKEFSVIDALTGLFNRQHFRMRLGEEIRRSGRYCNTFSFAIVDIDDFRLFNDTEGRLAGDSVLTEIAEIAHRCIRVYDILSRFGGEEFGILMPHTDKDSAFVVAERIRNNVKASLKNKWETFPRPGITVSIGISFFPHDGKNIDELMESADTALYKAKSTGKDKTVVYSFLYDDEEDVNAT